MSWAPRWIGASYSRLYVYFGLKPFTMKEASRVLRRKDSFCRVLLSQMVKRGLIHVERNGRRRSYRLKEALEYVLEVSGFFSNLEKIRQREYMPLIQKVMLATST